MKVAAIDIGSNAVRMIICEVENNKIVEHIEHCRFITRLGDKVKTTGILSDRAIFDTLEVLITFKALMDKHRVDRYYAVATSAVRESANSKKLLNLALQEGIKINIIPGEQEAELIYTGVKSGFDDMGEAKTLLFDVGGGSTEFIYSDPAVKGIKALSVPLGVVKLADMYDFSKPCFMEHMDRIKIPIFNVLKEVISSLNCKPEILIGSAGTPTTLAAIDLEMTKYDWTKTNGYIVSREKIGSIFESLCTISAKDRLDIAGMEKGREDLIIPGILITMELMDSLGINELKISDFGLREGVAIAASNL